MKNFQSNHHDSGKREVFAFIPHLSKESPLVINLLTKYGCKIIELSLTGNESGFYFVWGKTQSDYISL